MNSVEKHGKSIAFALCAASFAPVAFTVMANEGAPESASSAVAYSAAPISSPAAADTDPTSDSVYVEESAAPQTDLETPTAAAAVPAASYSMKAELQNSAAAAVSEIEAPAEAAAPEAETPEIVQVPEETETVIAAVSQVSVPEEPVMIAPLSQETQTVMEETPAAAPVEAAVMSAPAFEKAPAVEEAVPEEPEAEAPVSEEAEAPVAEEVQVYEEPAAEEPVYTEPVYEAPAIEEPAYTEPVYEAPAVEEPVNTEPAAEEPVAEEPVHTEPVYEEPEYTEPVYDESEYTEPVTEEPEYTEPVVEEPAVDKNADLNESIRNAALGLVGTTDGMQCTDVAALALQYAGVTDAISLWPDEFAGAYGYYTDTPQAGNLIYYNNGSRGTDHIAVYIGDGQAVHGNYHINGESYTVIAGAEIEGAGTPQYIQVNP